MAAKGKVFIVGAGPGDADLITVKGLEILRVADVILYDHLVNERLLDQIKPDAELLYVGKISGDHSRRQAEINRLLKEHCARGSTVVRLKGGDPFIFGRGGEEALELAECGFAFEVVPGVSSATAVPAYAGIPLTQRHVSSTVAFVTGHEHADCLEESIDWNRLATSVDTLVILMGLSRLECIAKQLLAAGKDSATPVAVIGSGTTADQKTIVGSLADIAAAVQNRGLEPPALIVVGEVVRLRDKLDWFETEQSKSKPLAGRTIALLRSADTLRDIDRSLESLGAKLILFTTTKTLGPGLKEPRLLSAEQAARARKEIAERLGEYKLVLLAGPRCVESLIEMLLTAGRDIRALAGIRLAAADAPTAEQMKRFGLVSDIQAAEPRRDDATAAVLADAALSLGRTLLLSEGAPPTRLVHRLTSLGAHFDSIPMRTTAAFDPAKEGIAPQRSRKSLLEALQSDDIDLFAFADEGAVASLVEDLDEKLRRTLTERPLACAGRAVAAAVETLGFSVDVTTDEEGRADLADRIGAYFARVPRRPSASVRANP